MRRWKVLENANLEICWASRWAKERLHGGPTKSDRFRKNAKDHHGTVSESIPSRFGPVDSTSKYLSNGIKFVQFGPAVLPQPSSATPCSAVRLPGTTCSHGRNLSKTPPLVSVHLCEPNAHEIMGFGPGLSEQCPIDSLHPHQE